MFIGANMINEFAKTYVIAFTMLLFVTENLLSRNGVS